MHSSHARLEQKLGRKHERMFGILILTTLQDASPGVKDLCMYVCVCVKLGIPAEVPLQIVNRPVLYTAMFSKAEIEGIFALNVSLGSNLQET